MAPFRLLNDTFFRFLPRGRGARKDSGIVSVGSMSQEPRIASFVRERDSMLVERSVGVGLRGSHAPRVLLVVEGVYVSNGVYTGGISSVTSV